MTDTPQSVSALYKLVYYDEKGITLRRLPGKPGLVFVPWAPVLRMEEAFLPEDEAPGQS